VNVENDRPLVRFTKYPTIILRQCQSYDRLTTEVGFTKHLAEDARLFLGTIRLKKIVSSSEIVYIVNAGRISASLQWLIVCAAQLQQLTAQCIAADAAAAAAAAAHDTQ